MLPPMTQPRTPELALGRSVSRLPRPFRGHSSLAQLASRVLDRGATRHFFILLLASILLACPAALALDPALDLSQYAHTAWKIRDGFFKGAILAIAQTPDGYLWLGTEFGLLRFDGVRAVPWAAQHLPPGRIVS